MVKVASTAGMKLTVTGEHRTGLCENCGTLTHKELYMDGQRRRVRMVCPACGGQGRLIVKTYSVQPPKMPQCATPRHLIRFMRDSLFSALVATYHAKRVSYAERNRDKVILERYRTGEPSPKTLWQAIHANIKLRCPVCRKYNRDPLLFGGK